MSKDSKNQSANRAAADSKNNSENTVPADDAGVYVISVAAEISGMHPQTLRQYDKLGLVSPSRTEGRNRRYSLRDIALLRAVQKLVGEGINHAGIKRIIELESAMANLSVEVAQLRIEVDALIKENPPKGLATRRKAEVIVYKQEK
jgi:MerR family transcriptional regulator/heat shock protein HspR